MTLTRCILTVFDTEILSMNRSTSGKRLLLIVDLLDIFQRTAEFKRLYLVRSTHWNEDGNALAGKITADFIKKIIP